MMLDFGLNRQALAVALYVNPAQAGWQPEKAWDDARGEYLCRCSLKPWYNGRETGVVFQYVDNDNPYLGPCLNIAVFEHRNHDGICAWSWFSSRVYTQPGVEHIPEHIAPNKRSHSHAVPYGRADEMATWILGMFDKFHGRIAEALKHQEEAAKRYAETF